MPKRVKPLSNLYDWLDLLDNPDPMDALDKVRGAIRQFAEQKKLTNYDTIGFIAECPRKADDDAEYATSLKSSAVFSGDNTGPRKLPVLIARYILDEEETSGAGYEKARSYGQLAKYFAQTDWHATQIAEYLDQYGIRNSLERFRKVEQKAAEEFEATDEKADRGDEGATKSSADSVAPEPDKVPRSPAPRPSSRQEIADRALAEAPSSAPSRPKMNYNTMLVLDATADLMAQMFRLEVGEAATITVYRERNQEGQDWYRFIVSDIADL